MYKLTPDTSFGKSNVVLRLTDNACIPFNKDNRDYQEYLKWLEKGNTPLPAEEISE